MQRTKSDLDPLATLLGTSLVQRRCLLVRKGEFNTGVGTSDFEGSAPHSRWCQMGCWSECFSRSSPGIYKQQLPWRKTALSGIGGAERAGWPDCLKTRRRHQRAAANSQDLQGCGNRSLIGGAAGPIFMHDVTMFLVPQVGKPLFSQILEMAQPLRNRKRPVATRVITGACLH